jgi:hypothetical protein
MLPHRATSSRMRDPGVAVNCHFLTLALRLWEARKAGVMRDRTAQAEARRKWT